MAIRRDVGDTYGGLLESRAEAGLALGQRVLNRTVRRPRSERVQAEGQIACELGDERDLALVERRARPGRG